MKKKIFGQMCLLSLTTMLLTTFLVLSMVYASHLQQMQQRIRGDAALLKSGLEISGDAFLQTAVQALPSSDRITIIAPDGTVSYDSQAYSETMENHKDRAEVDAVLHGAASSEVVRESKTIGKRTFYYAISLQNGCVLRISVQVQSVWGEMHGIWKWLFGIGIFILLLSVWIAQKMAAAIITPLEKLDLAHPLDAEVYEELLPLLKRIDKQNISIAQQMQALSAKQEEFRALSECMKEGLLLLDRNAAIISINHSALQILGGNAEKSYVGQHILQLTRVYALQQIIEHALHGEDMIKIISFDAVKQYQVFSNTIQVDETQRGVLLLFLDVTEQQQAEQLRREFSANVSHELKTPLTSISGYAEMLASGMVKAEDVQNFCGRIYQEAQRLLVLIEDIMKLSGLDEQKQNFAKEEVDIYEVAKQTAARLQIPAQKNAVTITVEGTHASICAVPSMIQELLYNLTENAVKYNRKDGTVIIRIEQEQESVLLAVQDTGIGIASADQPHIFERFYRVDKSRSKETGGTGLGLSIVKHIAQLHDAKITLQSKMGEGTVMQLRFPKIS